MADVNELMEYVESQAGLSWVRGGGPTNRSWNGIRYKIGLSGINTIAKKRSMNLATVPRVERRQTSRYRFVGGSGRSSGCRRLGASRCGPARNRFDDLVVAVIALLF